MFQGQGTNSLFDLKPMMLPYLALKIIFPYLALFFYLLCLIWPLHPIESTNYFTLTHKLFGPFRPTYKEVIIQMMIL